MAARETQDALFNAISKTLEEVMTSGSNAANKVGRIQDLALAYRYVVGGAQPGSVIVEK